MPNASKNYQTLVKNTKWSEKYQTRVKHTKREWKIPNAREKYQTRVKNLAGYQITGVEAIVLVYRILTHVID